MIRAEGDEGDAPANNLVVGVDEPNNDNRDGVLDDEDPIPPIMSRDDPRRLKLTRDEGEWAMDVKECVEMMPDLDNMPDLMYVQLSMVVKNDLSEVVRRAFGLQDFRREYDILETYEQGCRCLDRMFELMPDHFLSFSYCQQEGTYVFAHDATKLETANLPTATEVEDYLRGTYYMYNAFFPDVESVRKGVVCLTECEGWDWTKKHDFKIFQKIFSELLTIYPFNGQGRNYHTGLLVNVMASMLRQILPSHLQEKFKTGLTFEGRLDTFFLIPDKETALTRMLERLKASLKRRYIHEITFSLKES